MAYSNRSTSLGQALRYKGREGMWTWILHRATGIGILLFLIIHVVDTALVIYWPNLYDHALGLYRSSFFRIAELGIVFSVLFHGVNGLRIIIQDFWPVAMLRQRQMVYVTAAVVVLSMLPISWMMLAPIFGLASEPGTARHHQRLEREREERLMRTSPSADAPAGLEVHS